MGRGTGAGRGVLCLGSMGFDRSWGMTGGGGGGKGWSRAEVEWTYIRGDRVRGPAGVPDIG